MFNFASDTVYKYVQPPNFFELPPPMAFCCGWNLFKVIDIILPKISLHHHWYCGLIVVLFLLAVLIFRFLCHTCGGTNQNSAILICPTTCMLKSDWSDFTNFGEE